MYAPVKEKNEVNGSKKGRPKTDEKNLVVKKDRHAGLRLKKLIRKTALHEAWLQNPAHIRLRGKQLVFLNEKDICQHSGDKWMMMIAYS